MNAPVTTPTTLDGQWRLGYRPALDVVRGVAIALVLVDHAKVPLVLGSAGIGVTLFFVLSGFLITTLLLEERDRAGRVDLLAFYWRRALRLLPALVVCVVIVTTVALAIGYELAWIQAGFALSYFGNWIRVAIGGENFGVLGHAWSLAVEEQFYLLWPLVVAIVVRRRTLFAIAIGATVVSFGLRFALWGGPQSGWPIYYGSFTAFLPILLGILVSFAIRAGYSVPAWSIVPVALLYLAFTIGADYASPLTILVALPVIGLASTLVVAVAARSGARNRPLEGLGRISYGLYLWHRPVAEACAVAFGLPLILGMIPAVGVAALSYRFVELPFLRLRHRRRSGSPRLATQS